MVTATDASEQVKRKFVIRVDGAAVEMSNPRPTGKAILKAAGKVPAEQFLLIQLFERGSRSVSLEEEVELKDVGIELFYSFPGDRLYRFIEDGTGYDWGAGTISETQLRQIAAVPEAFALELIQGGGGRVLQPGEVVSLDGQGIEQFRRVKRLVKVMLGEVVHHIPAGEYTTEQLIQVLGVQPGYLLNVQTEEGLVTLKPNEKLRVVDCMQFVEQVPCGGAS